MTENDDRQQAHSPLDALLGAAPRRVLRHWFSLLVLALAALGALIFFVRFVTGDDSPYYSAPVERGNLVPLVSERGRVRGSGETIVPSAIRGRVIWANGRIDTRVEKDELLAVLDARQVTSAVAIGQSRLDAAQATLDAAKIAARDAATRLARFENVWKRSRGRAPSLNEIERARTEASQADLGVTTALAEVEAAELQLKDQHIRQAGTAVRAPIAGTLVMRHVQPGQTVAANQPLFTIAAGLEPLTVKVPLAVRPGAPLKAGTPAQLRLDALPDVPHTATLLRLEANPPGAVFTISQPDPRVRPGMTATVEIHMPERHNVLLVPNAALAFEPVDQQDRTAGARRDRIYIEEYGDPRRVYVTVGGTDGKRSEVFGSGLKPGDRAITGWRGTTSGAERSPR